MIKPTYYGWYDPKVDEFRLSLYPADAPIRPSIALGSMDEVRDLAKRRRAKILWHPPLPRKFLSHAE
jgi:hypothetical protein